MVDAVRGEGGTGCVVDGIPCYGFTRKYAGRVVSKLYDKQNARDVDRMHYEQYIRMVDPNAEMTVPILDTCVTRDLPSRARRCRLVRNSTRDEPYYPQNVMPSAGVTLDVGARSVGSGEAMLALLAPLFRLVQRLDRRYLCHFDIKPGNVMYDAAERRVRVIDYGLMQAQGQVYVAGSSWERYYYYPPELYVMKAVLNGRTLYQASDLGRQHLASYQSFFPAIRELYPFEQAEDDYNAFVLELKKNNLLFPTSLANRIDVFGMGTCLLEIWPSLRWATPRNRAAAAAFVRGLLCANPARRPSPAVAYKAYLGLVHGMEVAKKPK